MSNQVQCPNCGGYKVSMLKKYFVDKKSGKIIRNGVMPSLLGFISIFICLPIFFPRGLQGNSLMFGVFAVLALILVIIAINDVAKFVNADKVGSENFICDLCGYSWSERSDEPKPLVTLRSDLIAKGAKKLEEDRQRKLEEDRRRQQED